jgi:PAS domain S-box-containing protein
MLSKYRTQGIDRKNMHLEKAYPELTIPGKSNTGRNVQKSNGHIMQALRESKARYELSAKLSGQMVYEYNATSTKFIWAGAIKDISGYSPEDFAGFGVKDLVKMIHPDDRNELITHFTKALLEKSGFSAEYRFRHKSGKYIWIETQSFALELPEPTKDKFIGVLKDISAKKKHQRQILQSIMNTEERERVSFSQELHDGLGPNLSAIKMYIQLLSKAGSSDKVPEIVTELEKLVNEASSILRDISFKLSPHVLRNHGLEEAISEFAERIIKPSGIQFDLDSQCQLRLNQASETILYRVLCECLNNTIKHAGARRIRMSIQCNEQYYLIKYTDDGKGFNLKKALSPNNGLGLMNMQNRIKSIDGFIDIKSRPNEGTCIQIKIIKTPNGSSNISNHS